MPQHSANEQYLLELINAERAKAGSQPLAFDNDLSESAENHDKWMLATDIFSHTGAGGSSSTTRMKAAGYTLTGSWATGENIAWATTRNPTGYADEVKLLHTNLMNSSGHRANILNPNFREVGLGFEVGDYKGRSSAFVTENFGKTGTDLFLTGVAFDDKDGDRFYDPGEGMGAITIAAKNAAGQTFTTTTAAAGGYDLVLKPGTYTVTFSGSHNRQLHENGDRRHQEREGRPGRPGDEIGYAGRDRLSGQSDGRYGARSDGTVDATCSHRHDGSGQRGRQACQRLARRLLQEDGGIWSRSRYPRRDQCCRRGRHRQAYGSHERRPIRFRCEGGCSRECRAF